MTDVLKNKLIITVIFVLFIGSILVVWKKPPKLGLDLQGGMRLVVEAKDTAEIKVNDQAMEGVVGALMVKNQMILPGDLDKPRGDLRVVRVTRDVSQSPI